MRISSITAISPTIILQRIRLLQYPISLVMKICERIQVLDFGTTIASGTPEEIANNQKVIEAYLGKEEEEVEREKPLF